MYRAIFEKIAPVAGVVLLVLSVRIRVYLGFVACVSVWNALLEASGHSDGLFSIRIVSYFLLLNRMIVCLLIGIK